MRTAACLKHTRLRSCQPTLPTSRLRRCHAGCVLLRSTCGPAAHMCCKWPTACAACGGAQVGLRPTASGPTAHNSACSTACGGAQVGLRPTANPQHKWAYGPQLVGLRPTASGPTAHNSACSTACGGAQVGLRPTANPQHKWAYGPQHKGAYGPQHKWAYGPLRPTTPPVAVRKWACGPQHHLAVNRQP